jgi:hypothetical protein
MNDNCYAALNRGWKSQYSTRSIDASADKSDSGLTYWSQLTIRYKQTNQLKVFDYHYDDIFR